MGPDGDLSPALGCGAGADGPAGRRPRGRGLARL